MWPHDYYVREKLREFESEQLTRLALRAEGPHPRQTPMIGPFVRGAGRLLRRMGEGLESWAGHEPEAMQLERKPQ
jgi:hypothetical protein